MKKRILTLMLCASLYNSMMGQVPASCPANSNDPTKEYCKDGHGISTNPDNLINEDCPDLKNDFEWRLKQTPTLTRPADERFVMMRGNDLIELRNPFNVDDALIDYIHLANNHNSNYHPKDGWELLKIDFGMLSNIGLPHSTNPGRNVDIAAPKLPYFILYNKYSGTFRFFGTLIKPNNDYHTIKIELRIPKRSPNVSVDNFYNDHLKATNLLSISGETVQPLDEETEESVMVVFASATNNEEAFFWFDIPVAYDPCLCNIRSQLDISFTFVKTGNISLNGVIDGALKTTSKNDGTPKGIKVANSVIAAGI